MTRHLALAHDLPDDDAHDSLEHGQAQADAALRELARPPAQYMAYPFAELAHVLGGIAPGEVDFACAFSGGGKTLFTTNVEDTLLRQGRRVYHIGLETRPAIVRLHFACLRLGYYVGDVVSGRAKGRDDWPAMERAIRAEIERQRRFPDDCKLILNKAEWLNEGRLIHALEEAAQWSADLVVIDHIDHIEPYEGEPEYQASRRIIRTLNTYAQRLQLRVLALSQLNNQAVLADRLAVYRPPQPQHVFGGGHKRQIATRMLGIYRPLKTPIDPDLHKAVRDGLAEPLQAVEPDVMAVSVMKHRHYGSREGTVMKLHVDHGRLV